MALKHPLDLYVWSILESRVCRTRHDSLEKLKIDLQREWGLNPQEVMRAACEVCYQEWRKSYRRNAIDSGLCCFSCNS